jgi:hypothetical protein
MWMRYDSSGFVATGARLKLNKNNVLRIVTSVRNAEVRSSSAPATAPQICAIPQMHQQSDSTKPETINMALTPNKVVVSHYCITIAAHINESQTKPVMRRHE